MSEHNMQAIRHTARLLGLNAGAAERLMHQAETEKRRQEDREALLGGSARVNGMVTVHGRDKSWNLRMRSIAMNDTGTNLTLELFKADKLLCLNWKDNRALKDTFVEGIEGGSMVMDFHISGHDYTGRLMGINMQRSTQDNGVTIETLWEV